MKTNILSDLVYRKTDGAQAKHNLLPPATVISRTSKYGFTLQAQSCHQIMTSCVCI